MTTISPWPLVRQGDQQHPVQTLQYLLRARGRNLTVDGIFGPGTDTAVRDLPAAVDELRRAGVELLGEPGPTWQHFRGPDGNVYELVAS